MGIGKGNQSVGPYFDRFLNGFDKGLHALPASRK